MRVFEEFRKAQNTVHRGAYFMADVGQKRWFQAVALFSCKFAISDVVYDWKENGFFLNRNQVTEHLNIKQGAIFASMAQ